MRTIRFALATTLWLLTLPAASAVADDARTPGPVPIAAHALVGTTGAGGYVPRLPPYALTLAFGDEAMGGVGQCGNPSDRASRRCRLRLAEGGPSVPSTGAPSPAVGIRFLMRF